MCTRRVTIELLSDVFLSVFPSCSRYKGKPIGYSHDDVIWLQLPECFETSYCIQQFFFCEELLVRSEVHSGSCSRMMQNDLFELFSIWTKKNFDTALPGLLYFIEISNVTYWAHLGQNQIKRRICYFKSHEHFLAIQYFHIPSKTHALGQFYI